MQTIYFALLGLLFVLICAIGWKAMQQWSPDPLRRRLDRLASRADAEKPDGQRQLNRLLLFLGRFSNDKNSLSTRTRLTHAGWRAPTAHAMYYGAKTGLLVLFPLFVLPLVWMKLYGANEHTWLWMLPAAAIGFYLPDVILKRTIGRRRRQITNSIPNTMELVAISVEAGLGLDAAIMRVAISMGAHDQALKQEFDSMLLELNAGVTREAVLRSLATRTGVEELRTLASLLIQADRFGISVGESLRAYTAMLHVRRQQRAEEEAGKITVKLLFPLVLTIFPVLIMVLLAPAVIQIYRILFATMGGQS